ncbi:hypothetical protein OIU91_03695 [Streptomyces sp. NBC_01456]|uniref:hypothetical protein n=1 Tax=unclassified Streptomyces TaxID=2593676 RepID=UPI002E33BFE3|nr:MULTISPECIES: hypothetical protein [unclassified Streptomyces]
MSAAPKPAAAYARLSVVEARMLAYLACAAAGGRPVTANDLALLPGPAGKPVGLREAFAHARDLIDSGWVKLPGLVTSARHEPLPVLLPGPKVPAQAVQKVVKGVKHDSAAPPPKQEETVGRLGKKLPIPASLPDDLKTELLALSQEFAGGGPKDPHELLKLIERRAAALARWATLPQATTGVLNEAERVKKTLETARNHPALRADNAATSS